MKRRGNTGDQKCRWEREPPPGISSKVILVISGRAARCTKALSPSRREQSVLRGQCLRHCLALLTTLCQYAYWLESFIQGIAVLTELGRSCRIYKSPQERNDIEPIEQVETKSSIAHILLQSRDSWPPPREHRPAGSHGCRPESLGGLAARGAAWPADRNRARRFRRGRSRPSAARKQPSVLWPAPVNAPLMWPNN